MRILTILLTLLLITGISTGVSQEIHKKYDIQLDREYYISDSYILGVEGDVSKVGVSVRLHKTILRIKPVGLLVFWDDVTCVDDVVINIHHTNGRVTSLTSNRYNNQFCDQFQWFSPTMGEWLRLGNRQVYRIEVVRYRWGDYIPPMITNEFKNKDFFKNILWTQ